MHQFRTGCSAVPASSFKSSVMIGVQPTAVARRKVPVGGKRRASTGRPKKDGAARRWRPRCLRRANKGREALFSGGALSASPTQPGGVCGSKRFCGSNPQCLMCSLMCSIFSGRMDCHELVAKFSLVTQVRRSRHTGLFRVPFGRVNAVNCGLFIRLPNQLNKFLHEHSEADFFQPSRHWRALLLRFASSQGTFNE